MKNITKKWLILLLLNLLIPIKSISQITFDSIEVKEIALICAEHNKFSIENPLLKQQIKSLEELNQLYINTDSIRKEEIKLYNEKVASNEKQIQHLESSRRNILNGSIVGGIVLFILGLIL